MTKYAVTFAASAKRELQDLPSAVLDRMLARIRELSRNPRPVGTKKLRGYKDRWRLRIGRYRLVYSIDDESRVVDITRIAHRREAYD